MKLMTKTALVGAGLLVAYSAQAALLATHTRNANYTYAEGTTPFVPLNDAGATTITFNTGVRNQKVIVSYTAECGIIDNKNDTWVNIDIQVDGVAIRPTNNTSDAFCSSTNNAGYNWNMSAVNAVYIVPNPGVHTVRIRAAVQSGNGGATGWLGDTSLVVWR